jgi:hypothetical protein
MQSNAMPSEAIVNYKRELCVFINCPYDPDYLPLFNAAVFTIVCCGLIPICALTKNNPAISRLDRLIDLISDAKYSIHDLCRCYGQGQQNFARLNMPLELGITIGLSSTSNGQAADGHVDPHRWTLLVKETDSKDHEKFVSDLKSSDPPGHKETPETIISAIMNIIVTGYELSVDFRPSDVFRSLAAYERRLQQEREAWLGGTIPWENTVKLALEIAQTEGLIPVG